MYFCVFLWTIIVFQVFRYVLSGVYGVAHGVIDAPRPRFMAAVAGVLALTALHHESDDRARVVATTIPTEAVMSPLLATLILKDLLQRRQVQCLELPIGKAPVVLDEQAQNILDDLLQTVAENENNYSVSNINTEDNALLKSAVDHNDSLKILYAAVDRVEPLVLNDELHDVDTRMGIIVRLFGYPLVENHLGIRAEFRKTRALELATWLVLNRQRSRRSAARTAMWEQSVSDSTFSTIVSDVRRALGS